MNVYCRGTARIRHRVTNKIHEIGNEELDWDAVGGDERQMGSEIHYQTVLEHPDLGALNWSLSEYPVGVENYHETNAGEHEVIEDFDYGLEHEESEPDNWISYLLPDNPFTIFSASYQQTSDLLTNHGKDAGTYLLNRMVFSHQITALEAYLCDTLLNEVLRDNDAIARLMQKNSDLAQMKFTLTEIAENPNLVEEKVREYLRSVLYHNLAKVNVLYGIALQLRILPPVESDKKDLFETVSLRHDCIHRNGFDKNGTELTVFTRQFVQQKSDLIKGFVDKIEKEVRARSPAHTTIRFRPQVF
jgi:hypothetical protein